MALLGIGTDICDIRRMKQKLSRSGIALAEVILTDTEMRVFSLVKDQGQLLATSFALKEATAKAIGSGFSQGLGLHDINISYEDKLVNVSLSSGYCYSKWQMQEVQILASFGVITDYVSAQVIISLN